MANQYDPQAVLGVYRRAVAEAAHKHSLIQTVARKGPKAIAAAVDAASKAAKRRDAYAAKLAAFGVDVTKLTQVEGGKGAATMGQKESDKS